MTPTRWGDWGDPVLCQECYREFKRPESLEPWQPATHCSECREVSHLLSEAHIDSTVTRAREKRAWMHTEHILHPALMNVESVIIRRPGDPGWALGESQGSLLFEEDK